MLNKSNQIYFNIFSCISTFARALVETFISLFLLKHGFTIKEIIIFFLIVNFIAIPLSYFFVLIGEKTKYSYVMIIGIIAFLIFQLLLNYVNCSFSFLLISSIIYSIYRRGYWVSRRFYITKIMPNKKSSNLFSIILVLAQISSIIAGYIGSYILDNFSVIVLMVISSILLFVSIIPLFFIKYEKETNKICLIKNLKKYDFKNIVIFSSYELNNILTIIFPLYVALYISNTYVLLGNINAVNNVAIIIFVVLYGKLISKEKNYCILSTILVLICVLLKINIESYFILIVYFIEGIATKMQNQSINKIYFEERNGMDLTHYNLIYQIIEGCIRFLVLIPLLFISKIKVMILFVVSVMFILLLIYVYLNKKNIKE